MKKLFFIPFLFLFLNGKGQAPTCVWAKALNGEGGYSTHNITVDNEQNVLKVDDDGNLHCVDTNLPS